MNTAPETEKTAETPATPPAQPNPLTGITVPQLDAAMQEYLAPSADRVAVIAKYPFLVPILNQQTH